MGVTPLRLLITSAALVIGAALMPALSAVAAPEPVVAGAVVRSDREIAAMTESESALDAAAQRVSDPEGRMLEDRIPEPPMWLLVLLVPILLGGVVGVGVTLRRVR